MVDCFANGTYQLSDLDGVLHALRVNGLRLRIYHASIMMVEKEELEEEIDALKNVETWDATSFVSLFVAVDHE